MVMEVLHLKESSVGGERCDGLARTAGIVLHLHGYPYEKLSYHRQTVQHTMSVEIWSTAAQMDEKIAFYKACNRWMSLKVTQGHWIWHDSITSY